MIRSDQVSYIHPVQRLLCDVIGWNMTLGYKSEATPYIHCVNLLDRAWMQLQRRCQCMRAQRIWLWSSLRLVSCSQLWFLLTVASIISWPCVEVWSGLQLLDPPTASLLRPVKMFFFNHFQVKSGDYHQVACAPDLRGSCGSGWFDSWLFLFACWARHWTSDCPWCNTGGKVCVCVHGRNALNVAVVM